MGFWDVLQSMSMKRGLLMAAMVLAVAGCGSLKPRPVMQPFLQAVKQVEPDGSIIEAKEKQLSPFQTYMRDRITSGNAMQGKKSSGWKAARLVEAVLLEADVPASEEGYEGAYMAVLLFSDGTGLLEYHEQAAHGPRFDRYYHRQLTKAERNSVAGFLKEHPVDSLHAKPEGEEEASGLVFRITDATAKTATSVGMAENRLDDSAATLVKLFASMRDAQEPALVCTYLQAIPMDARVLFASPTRQVINVWAKEEEVRIEVQEAAGQSKWMTLREGEWTESIRPTESGDVQPTRQAAATQALVPVEQKVVVAPPKEEPAFPRLPRRPTTAELLARVERRPAPLPTKESWIAEPRQGHTLFTHFVPRAGGPGGIMPQGESVQMIIPGLVFDNAHMAMARGVLYVVHGGQLVGMPLPAGVK